jgi:protein-S-isoprenylcysteine O-methyltransferase Ste14
VVIGTGALAAVSLSFTTVPYGRHVRKGWGPSMGVRMGWILMESPALLGFGAVYFAGRHRFELAPLLFLTLWMLHYLYRTVVFSHRIDAPHKRMPVAVVAMGALFNVLNAYLNARQVSELGSYTVSWLFDLRFLAGVLLFLAGRELNLRSDASLLALRGRDGYGVPQGGAFRWVSCPNYLGEIVEWLGWALATWSLSGAAFAFFTAANLAPRARAHHRWYKERFADYPAERKALLPHVW